MAPQTLTEIQEENREVWCGHDMRLLEEIGLCGGIPYGILEHEIETGSERLKLMIQITLALAEDRGIETWRTRRKKAPDDASEWELANTWTSLRPLPGHSGSIVVAVYKHKATGRARAEFRHFLPEIERLQFLVNTYGVRMQSSFAKAEEVAFEKLKSLLTPSQQLAYMMNDCFFMKGGQSGNRYLVRKNRPTIAFGADDQPLCALCLHPLAYYTGTWAGAMVPSDEAWVHINYIRTDEHRFWRKANQIPLHLANSGV